MAGSTTDIVSQPGTTNKVDSLGDELMQRVVYRKIGSADPIWSCAHHLRYRAERQRHLLVKYDVEDATSVGAD